jgi:hypothetical protein
MADHTPRMVSPYIQVYQEPVTLPSEPTIVDRVAALDPVNGAEAREKIARWEKSKEIRERALKELRETFLTKKVKLPKVNPDFFTKMTWADL